jgi:acetyl-CoA carboxylase carboxyl transferase subunit alpha
VVDSVVSEPLGGGHRAPAKTVAAVGEALAEALRPLLSLDGPTLRAQRRDKFLAIGAKGL